MSLLLNLTAGESLLERFGEAHLLDQGLLAVVSVEAIRSRAGARWSQKQETVWEFAEREFRRDFAVADQIVRLDDIHYLLVQPEETPYRAQGRAINFLREVLEFFLGCSTAADVLVGRVKRIAADMVEHALLPIDEIAAALASPVPKSPLDQAGARRKGAGPGVQGDPGALAFITQPIWAVQKRAVASYRLRPLCPPVDCRADGANDTCTRAIVEFDLQIVDRALHILKEQREKRFGLHIPIQIRTLNSIPGRQAVLARLRRSVVPTGEALVVCLQGLDAGVPRMVLETAVSALRPACLGVVARAPSLWTDVSAWRGARLSAVSFDFNDAPPGDDAELSQALSRFAANAAGVGSTLIGHSLTSRARVIAAWAAGFTHLSGDVLEQRAALPFTPVRFEAASLYDAHPA